MSIPGKWTLHLDQEGFKPKWRVFTPGGEQIEVLSCRMDELMGAVEILLDPEKFVVVKGDKIHEY